MPIGVRFAGNGGRARASNSSANRPAYGIKYPGIVSLIGRPAFLMRWIKIRTNK